VQFIARSLKSEPKWTRFPVSNVRNHSNDPTLSDLFQIKRGIATGDNNFFILSEDEIISRQLPIEAFTPILPSPRYLEHDEIKPRKDGSPDIAQRLFLLDIKLSEEEIQKRFPTLFFYLQEGKAHKLHQRYLCSHRSPWYSQENRPASPIVCTYLGRSNTRNGRPFRFILNESRATVANVYLSMYPKAQLIRMLDNDSHLIRKIWERLNRIAPSELLGESRVYGGGLHKLEPRELGSVKASFIIDLFPHFSITKKHKQLNLFDDDREQPANKAHAL